MFGLKQMFRRTRKNKKQRGGNDLGVREVFLMLGDAVTLLNRPVKLTLESEEGETKDMTIPTSEFVLFSMASTMIEKGADKTAVLDVLRSMDVTAPDEKYPYFSLRA